MSQRKYFQLESVLFSEVSTLSRLAWTTAMTLTGLSIAILYYHSSILWIAAKSTLKKKNYFLEV